MSRKPLINQTHGELARRPPYAGSLLLCSSLILGCVSLSALFRSQPTRLRNSLIRDGRQFTPEIIKNGTHAWQTWPTQRQPCNGGRMRRSVQRGSNQLEVGKEAGTCGLSSYSVLVDFQLFGLSPIKLRQPAASRSTPVLLSNSRHATLCRWYSLPG